MYPSIKVVPVCKAVRSSRIAPGSELGATSVCGPLRRDSQAGTARRLDRHDSGSMDRPGKTWRKTIIHHSHHGGVKPLGARMLGPPKNGTGSERGNRNSPRARGNDLVENERDTSARD